MFNFYFINREQQADRVKCVFANTMYTYFIKIMDILFEIYKYTLFVCVTYYTFLRSLPIL